MTREEKVQFIARSISEFEGIPNTEELQEEIRKLEDGKLESEYEFMEYLHTK